MMYDYWTIYGEDIEGKSSAEVRLQIQEWKDEIEELKRIIEHPKYDKMEKMSPSESVKIKCIRDYILHAKVELMMRDEELTYSPTEEWNYIIWENLKEVKCVVLDIGNKKEGYERYEFDVENQIRRRFSGGELQEENPTDYGEEFLLREFRELHLGEWREHYSLPFPYKYWKKGKQWTLRIQFKNDFPELKFTGDRAYPYNFDQIAWLLSKTHHWHGRW